MYDGVTQAQLPLYAAQTSLFGSNEWPTLAIGAALDYNVAHAWYWQLFSHHFDLTTAESTRSRLELPTRRRCCRDGRCC